MYTFLKETRAQKSMLLILIISSLNINLAQANEIFPEELRSYADKQIYLAPIMLIGGGYLRYQSDKQNKELNKQNIEFGKKMADADFKHGFTQLTDLERAANNSDIPKKDLVYRWRVTLENGSIANHDIPRSILSFKEFIENPKNMPADAKLLSQSFGSTPEYRNELEKIKLQGDKIAKKIARKAYWGSASISAGWGAAMIATVNESFGAENTRFQPQVDSSSITIKKVSSGPESWATAPNLELANKGE